MEYVPAFFLRYMGGEWVPIKPVTAFFVRSSVGDWDTYGIYGSFPCEIYERRAMVSAHMESVTQLSLRGLWEETGASIKPVTALFVRSLVVREGDSGTYGVCDTAFFVKFISYVITFGVCESPFLVRSLSQSYARICL